MAIAYYLLGFLFYFLGILEIILQKKKDKDLLYFIAFVVLLLFVGLKIRGGTDFASYESIYNGTDLAQLSSGLIEPLFVILMVIINSVGGSFIAFHFVVSMLNFSIKLTIFKKLTPFLFPALLIYLVGLFWERDNDGIRQGLSISFCYLSLPYLLSNKKIVYFLFILVAFLIHYSSAVFLISYFLLKVRISDRAVLVLVLISLLFPFLGVSLFDLLLSVVPIPAVAIKLSQYADSSVYSANLGINLGLIFRFIILCLFINYHHSLKITQELYNLLRNGFAFAIILSLLFSNFEILAHRLPYAFREFQIMIVPFFLTIAKGKGNKVVLLTVIFVYSLLLLYRFLSGESSDAYNSYDNLLFHIL